MQSTAQILLQLRGDELKQAGNLLQVGSVGLEVLDFAHPNLLTSGWEERLAELLPRLRQWAGPISMHGPFLDMSPVSPDPAVRQITLQRYRQALQIASQLQARYLVFHTQYNPNIKEASYSANWLQANIRFWSDLLPEIEASNTVVVLENLWDEGPQQLAELLQAVNSPYLRSCLDVAHAHLFSQATLTEWVQVLGETLAYVHLSDNRGQWDEHLALGDGVVDFTALWTALERRATQPWFVLEISSFEAACRSLRFLGR